MADFLVNRRNFLLSLAALGVAARLPSLAEAAAAPVFLLPPLAYPLDALEPSIDARTMQIHHDKHHAAYVKGLNEALARHPGVGGGADLETLLATLDQLPESLQLPLRNHGGGHWNHTFFWQILGPGKQLPSTRFRGEVEAAFGSWEKFVQAFEGAAMARFGSGWAWLVRNKAGQLEVLSTANQDCPLMQGHQPLLGLDVWEHAYYLKYQNRRLDYVRAFWNLVQWDEVEKRWESSKRNSRV